jgi:hypothetical protein
MIPGVLPGPPRAAAAAAAAIIIQAQAFGPDLVDRYEKFGGETMKAFSPRWNIGTCLWKQPDRARGLRGLFQAPCGGPAPTGLYSLPGKMRDVCSILVLSNAANDHHSDIFLDQFGYGRLRDGGNIIFGQICNLELEDESKRHLAFYYKCNGRVEAWRHVEPDDFSCIYLCMGLSIQEEFGLIKDIVDRKNKAYAISMALIDQVVRICLPNCPEDYFATVRGLAGPWTIEVVLLLNRKMALEFINNDSKNRKDSARDLGKAEIGENELLFTDWYGTVDAAFVKEVMEVVPDLGDEPSPVGERGRDGYYCRYVCKVQEERAKVMSARFELGWTLRAAAGADRTHCADFAAREDLQDWIFNLADCSVVSIPPPPPPHPTRTRSPFPSFFISPHFIISIIES